MNHTPDEQPLTGDPEPAIGQHPNIQPLPDNIPGRSGDPFAAEAQGQQLIRPLNVMTLEQVLAEAKRVERVAHICVDGTLENRFEELAAELAALVDENGNVVSAGDDEPSLEEIGKAETLNAEMQKVHDAMQAQMWHVRFRAMADDEWEVFDKRHRPNGPTTPVKDTGKWAAEMIAACAVEPRLTVDDVAALRKRFNKNQMTTLATEAYYCNITGGTDIPKLPSYSATQGAQS